LAHSRADIVSVDLLELKEELREILNVYESFLHDTVSFPRAQGEKNQMYSIDLIILKLDSWISSIN
jgi:hypothetical protein